jgi:hypothetical protein
MKICTITPDRGDRPELFQFCIKQINRMGMGNSSYLMNEKPKSDMIDLVPRIREGVEMAKRDGFEWAFIIENDDAYPVNYIENFGDLSQSDFVGYSSTLYYNIRNKTWQVFEHPGRSSLFCTGFRLSALDKFNWPKDNTAFLDIKLWEYANNHDKRINLLEGFYPVGIKHGIGRCGGKGHKMELKYKDSELNDLKMFVDAEALEFYRDLMEKL